MASAYGLNTPNLAWVSAKFDVQTAADKAHWVAPFKCVIKRVFVTMIDGATDAGGFTLKFDVVPAGSSTRGDGDGGAITVPAANRESYYFYEEPASAVILNPGASVFVEVTAEGVSALEVLAGIVYQEWPETMANAPFAVAG